MHVYMYMCHVHTYKCTGVCFVQYSTCTCTMYTCMSCSYMMYTCNYMNMHKTVTLPKLILKSSLLQEMLPLCIDCVDVGLYLMGCIMVGISELLASLVERGMGKRIEERVMGTRMEKDT